MNQKKMDFNRFIVRDRLKTIIKPKIIRAHLNQSLVKRIMEKNLKLHKQNIQSEKKKEQKKLSLKMDPKYNQLFIFDKHNERQIFLEIQNNIKSVVTEKSKWIKSWLSQDSQKHLKKRRTNSSVYTVIPCKQKQFLHQNHQILVEKHKITKKKYQSKQKFNKSFFRHLNKSKKGELVIKGVENMLKPRAKSSTSHYRKINRPILKLRREQKMRQFDFVPKPWQFELCQQLF